MPASQGLRRTRSGTPALATACQTARSLARAPVRPSSRSPAARAAALTAPALVALIQAMSRLASSSRRSSTPQVKAPCAPPPSSARLSCCRCRRNMLKRDAPFKRGQTPREPSWTFYTAVLARGLTPPPEVRIKTSNRAASWQHVEGQHNRHPIENLVARLDAEGGGKMPRREHVLGRARGERPAGVQE